MRKTPLIAAALLFASSAASAQVYGAECRGETLSELARCAAERAPAPAEESAPELGEVAPLSPERLQPRNLGGALQPTNQRAAPPRVGRSPAPVRSVDVLPTEPLGFDPLRGVTNDPTSPVYGAGRTNVERQRLLNPLGETRIRDRSVIER